MENIHSEHIDFRLGITTPCKISQSLCNSGIKPLYFTRDANAPISNSVILTDSFICDHFT
jgi:hypothetical protein